MFEMVCGGPSTTPTTSRVPERLFYDVLLRSICGWSRPCDVPSASTFSRAFNGFSEAKLSTRINEALIKHGYAGEQVWHISWDSTAIEALQKSVPKKQAATLVKKRKRGASIEGEGASKGASRLEKQVTMKLKQMLEAMPKDCSWFQTRNYWHKCMPWKSSLQTDFRSSPNLKSSSVDAKHNKVV